MIFYPPFHFFTLFCFQRCSVSSPNFNEKQIPRRFGADLFIDFLRIYVSNEALSEDTIQITLQLDEPGLGLKPSTHLMEPEGLNLKE